jgi:hypothetical protein
VSHSLDLTDQQRAHLVLAELEFGRLTPLLSAARIAGLSGHQWQIASCLASAVADQAQRIAQLATSGPAGAVWAAIARRLRDAAARFEVEADLADVAADLVADAAGGVLGMSSDAAHDAA